MHSIIVLVWLKFTFQTVEELGGGCFGMCRELSRVRFGMSSSLRIIDECAFSWCAMEEIDIPDSVEELGDLCFSYNASLSSITFGEHSSLKLIGVEICEYPPNLKEIRGPKSIQGVLNKGGYRLTDIIN